MKQAKTGKLKKEVANKVSWFKKHHKIKDGNKNNEKFFKSILTQQ